MNFQQVPQLDSADEHLLHELYQLLTSLFEEGHLRRWVTFTNEVIAAQLPGRGASFADLVFETVRLFRRYGELDALFRGLEAEFPNRKADIRRVNIAKPGRTPPSHEREVVPNLLVRLREAGFFDELARVLNAEQAKSYLQATGLDPSRFSLRYMDNPRAWWSQAVAVFEHGSTDEFTTACRTLIKISLRDYPGNPVFRSVRNISL